MPLREEVQAQSRARWLPVGQSPSHMSPGQPQTKAEETANTHPEDAWPPLRV